MYLNSIVVIYSYGHCSGELAYFNPTLKEIIRAEAPASEVRPQGEDWGWLHEHSLKGAGAPQLAGRESGKKSGAAEEVRDHCFGVCKERGFRAPPKQAPETGASRGYQHRPQRRAWDAKPAAATTKKPVCKHRSLSTPPLPGACAARHCQGPMIQGQLPRENARRASGCCIVTLDSAATGSPRTLYPSLPPAWVSQSPLISCSVNPILSGREQMPSGNLHAEAGPNPKLNPGSCANEEEKGKSLPAASGAAD